MKWVLLKEQERLTIRALQKARGGVVKNREGSNREREQLRELYSQRSSLGLH